MKGNWPVPGGPYSMMPLQCTMPSFSTTSGGKIRDTNARRNISWNWPPRPPMPMSSNFQPASNLKAKHRKAEAERVLTHC